MADYDLSILIPARNEMFLGRTIEDILENIEANTEIITVLDGYKPDPPLSADPRVTLIYHPESIGQRAATNEAARVSKAKYLMKVDAHCSFEKGFDRKMLEAIKDHDDWTMVPIMKNLHAFDWVCPEGHRRYQGPSGPCQECGKETTKDVVWIAKASPNSRSYCFDSTPHFQYFGEYSKRPEGKGEITESMSLQGSCFMITRDKYFELNICDEAFGSWGSQGIEVAVKTWLSGGKVMVYHNTWYAHMFRTQGGDFSFPYPISGKDQKKAQNYARELFFENKWPLQKYPLSWLVEKFWPVRGWTEEDLKELKKNDAKFYNKEQEPVEEQQSEVTSPKQVTVGIIYYTDNEAEAAITEPVNEQIIKIGKEKDIPVVTAALKRKLDFGVKNIYFPSLKRGYAAMFKQIMSALENSTADIIFFCEADVLYHPSHFDFIPPEEELYYYNTNVWRARWPDGRAFKTDDLKQFSGLVAYRETLLKYFNRERLERVEQGEDDALGFQFTSSWASEYPNIDIRHGRNLSGNQTPEDKWSQSSVDKIPGWEDLKLFKEVVKKPFSPPLSKGVIYYTDNQLDEKIAKPIREQLMRAVQENGGIPIVSSSLKKMDFGIKNIHFPSLARGYPAMFKQILGALEHSTADIIYFCEHDVLYHPTHFEFTPEDKNTFYYNQNVWFLRLEDGHALHYDVNQLSGLVGYREALYIHFKERYDLIEREGFSRKMGFEPMTHNRVNWQHKFSLGTYKSRYPNVDVRHGDNLTGQRWKKSEFRNKKLLANWRETNKKIHGWGRTKHLIKMFE